MFETDITIPTSHAPFGGATGDFDFVKIGADWSGAAFKFVVADTAGSAKITLNGAAAGSEGISASYDADYVHPTTGAVVGATTVRGQIDETTLEALTGFPADITTPLSYIFDFLVTPSGEPQRLWAKGRVAIYKGIGD